MDPQSQFCHNPDYTAQGQLGLGSITVHSRKERRFRCSICGRTFAATRDTPFYRRKKPIELATVVITLICHSFPVQAIVAAFGLDERTVADLRDPAGRHAQQFHEHRALSGQVELCRVQADELYLKVVGRRLWIAVAMAVPSRLWPGGVVSERRDFGLILTVVGMVRRAAKAVCLLVGVDGLASDVTAFIGVSRDPLRTGQRGRPKLAAIPGLPLGQVIKHHSGRRLEDVIRRLVLGTTEAISEAISTTGTGAAINTSSIERLNATSQASMCPLVRRCRAIARGEGVMTGWMYLVGCAYKFCWEHSSLRVATEPGGRITGKDRTPAMAAGGSTTTSGWAIGPPSSTSTAATRSTARGHSTSFTGT